MDKIPPEEAGMEIDLEDRLDDLKLQMDFILRAFSCMAADETESGLKPTKSEAFHGMRLGQSLYNETIDISMQLARNRKHVKAV